MPGSTGNLQPEFLEAQTLAPGNPESQNIPDPVLQNLATLVHGSPSSQKSVWKHREPWQNPGSRNTDAWTVTLQPFFKLPLDQPILVEAQVAQDVLFEKKVREYWAPVAPRKRSLHR